MTRIVCGSILQHCYPAVGVPVMTDWMEVTLRWAIKRQQTSLHPWMLQVTVELLICTELTTSEQFKPNPS